MPAPALLGRVVVAPVRVLREGRTEAEEVMEVVVEARLLEVRDGVQPALVCCCCWW